MSWVRRIPMVYSGGYLLFAALMVSISSPRPGSVLDLRHGIVTCRDFNRAIAGRGHDRSSGSSWQRHPAVQRPRRFAGSGFCRVGSSSPSYDCETATKPPYHRRFFKDGYVFVGYSAPGLLDLRPVPVNPKCPGVVLHTTFVDNLLTDSFIADTPASMVILV